MNFNDTNESGLLSLIGALKSGMDPGTGVQMMNMIQQDQAQQVAQRQERLAGLSSLISGAASQGMTYGQTSALADAQPGPMGPAAENMIQALYPGADTPMQNARGEGMAPSTYLGGQALQDYRSDAQAASNGMQSVAYQPDPSAQMALQSQAMDLQSQQQAAAAEPAWATFQAYTTQAKAKGMDPLSAIQQFSNSPNSDNAALLSMDPDRVKAILTNVYGAQALALAGVQ